MKNAFRINYIALRYNSENMQLNMLREIKSPTIIVTMEQFLQMNSQAEIWSVKSTVEFHAVLGTHYVSDM